MRYRIWIKKYFIFSTFICFAIVGINYIVNPYGFFKPNIFKKADITKKMRFIKPIEVLFIKPKSIIIGTSRSLIGYDPSNNFFLKPSYNFSLEGTTIYELKRNLQWAIQQGNLKQVLFGLDYTAFSGNKTKIGVSDFEDYFKKYNYLKTLFGYDALYDDFNVIFQRQKFYYISGFKEPESLSRIFQIEYKSHKAAFLHTEIESFKNSKSGGYVYKNSKESTIGDFMEILEICYRNNVDLKMVINPSHIRMWEGLDYYIGYDTWLKWKKDVVKANEETAKKLGKQPFAIYDFAIYNKFTSESVPNDESAKMNYYWDASHFKKELGDMVLDEISGIKKHSNFGVKIDGYNIDDHLQNLRNDRAKFIDVKTHRKEIFESMNK